jgi:hypothetical protein
LAKLAGAIGVPEIIPVVADMDNPFGSVGLTMLYAYGVTPALDIVTGLNAVIAVPTVKVFVPTTAEVMFNIAGAVTVIVTVAGEDVPPELVAVYVNVSDPEYPDVGV